MANNTNSGMPDAEKVSIVDKVLKIPSCPIPPNFPLTKEQKIHLFEKLVEAGAIKQKEAADNWVPSNHKGNIRNASFDERKEYWKDTPEAERMDKWRTSTNAFLDEYKNDPTKKAAQTFLKKLLKRDDQKTLDEVEVTADNVYSIFMQGQGGGDVEFFARRIVEKTECNIDEIEQNINLIKRLGGIYGTNYARIATQLIQDFISAQKNPATAYSIIGTDSLQKDMDVAISQKARQQALYLVGANGTGKTTLLSNLILTDIRQGLGVALIEPHGDLTKTIIAGIPENRVKDVILLDMTDSDYPFGLNLFQCDTRNDLTEVAKTASFVMHVFEKVWGVGTHTPQLTQVLRNVTRTLIENPGTTFAEIPLLLWEDTVREKLLANLKNPQSQMFWGQYGRKTQRDRDELISSTINKVDAYLNEPMIANIVSPEKTTINFRQIMDEGKILLVHLSPQLEEMSRLIGAILIGQILMAAFSRVDTREEKRRQLNLFVDEFQRFATSDFATLISEARKFRIATTLSHQTLSQLDEANKAAAIAAGNLIVFRVSGDDAKTLARNFDTTPTKEIVGEEPVRAPVSDVIFHLVKRGHNNERVTRFAQVYLQNFEDLMNKIAQYADWQVYGDYLIELRVQEFDVRKSRELLNESLYRSMAERNAHFLIPPLALYMLAVAQADTSQQVFFRYINYSGWIIPPHYFQGFKKGAEAFGHPSFINQEAVGKFIGSCGKDRAKNAASEAVKMITELRFAMTILAQQPILVDTGQYQPKYQNRTFADMENEIAANLTKQPNFQAKVKLLSGEHVIQTKNTPLGLTGSQLTERNSANTSANQKKLLQTS